MGLAACGDPEPVPVAEPEIPDTVLRQPPPPQMDPADIPEPLEEPADESEL
ncbi:hypothetical protein [Isoalcanivorax beigongshangi]|uniref:Uncharacterized protein n=1 Tax=Isoalcanivorax beigongshangi TaxID=3238810 RepID=A0ABV4AE42_9GAMM